MRRFLEHFRPLQDSLWAIFRFSEGISKVILETIAEKCPSKSGEKAQKAGCLFLQEPRKKELN